MKVNNLMQVNTAPTGLMDFGNEEQKMTSKQIADLLGKDHKHVKQVIVERLVKKDTPKIRQISEVEETD